MKKIDVLKFFGDNDKAEVTNLYEKYSMARERDIPLFGNCFYSPNIWMFFEKNLKESGFCIASDGFFKESERRMISFNNVYNIPFPYEVIKVTNLSKFNKIEHRDYLGALLGLGIKREKVGDLLVRDNECYFPVCEEIKDFILNNLTSIGKSPCKVECVSKDFDPPSFNFEEIVILVQTLRLDSIVAKLAKLSRGKAQSMIDEGKVLIDYSTLNSKSSKIEVGSRITIRGIGKFILSDVIGNSKSGKFKVLIKKYT
ncbi:MAG: RNA-binding protein [Clostridium sp.]|nr:RNA-binding protein [Clostridium sp.]